jgi:hypothetical protein
MCPGYVIRKVDTRKHRTTSTTTNDLGNRQQGFGGFCIIVEYGWEIATHLTAGTICYENFDPVNGDCDTLTAGTVCYENFDPVHGVCDTLNAGTICYENFDPVYVSQSPTRTPRLCKIHKTLVAYFQDHW